MKPTISEQLVSEGNQQADREQRLAAGASEGSFVPPDAQDVSRLTRGRLETPRSN
jgi:hypothetical protein